MLVIQSFPTGRLGQPGLLSAILAAAVSAFGQFPVDQEAEPINKAELIAIGHVELLVQGLTHATEFQDLQLIEEGLLQHGGYS
jgi:hypothetical protein